MANGLLKRQTGYWKIITNGESFFRVPKYDTDIPRLWYEVKQSLKSDGFLKPEYENYEILPTRVKEWLNSTGKGLNEVHEAYQNE